MVAQVMMEDGESLYYMPVVGFLDGIPHVCQRDGGDLVPAATTPGFVRLGREPMREFVIDNGMRSLTDQDGTVHQIMGWIVDDRESMLPLISIGRRLVPAIEFMDYTIDGTTHEIDEDDEHEHGDGCPVCAADAEYFERQKQAALADLMARGMGLEEAFAELEKLANEEPEGGSE
jgi:hypothetical protein